MALYVVLRHPKRPDQVWSNGWRVDERPVDAIMTNGTVAPLCEQARRTDEYAYVHRCSWGGSAPEITCRARVSSVTPVGRDYLVSFTALQPLAVAPAVQPLQGDDYYFAAPPQGC